MLDSKASPPGTETATRGVFKNAARLGTVAAAGKLARPNHQTGATLSHAEPATVRRGHGCLMARITVTDLCYMLRELPIDQQTRSAVERLAVQVVGRLTGRQLEELHELCAARLPVVGFDETYRPNDEGLLLESLIDKLYEAVEASPDN